MRFLVVWVALFALSFQAGVDGLPKPKRTYEDFDILSSDQLSVKFLNGRRSAAAGLDSRFIQPFPDELEVTLDALGATFHFDLSLSTSIFGPNFKITRGNQIDSSRIHHRFYEASVSSVHGEGVGTITVYESEGNYQLSGSWFQNGVQFRIADISYLEHHDVEFGEAAKRHVKRISDSTSTMVAYKSRDIKYKGGECGVAQSAGFPDIPGLKLPGEPSYASAEEDFTSHSVPYSESIYRGKRTWPSGCQDELRAVYMGVAVAPDYASGGPFTGEVLDHVIELFNEMSLLYTSSFNIQISVGELVVSEAVNTSTWERSCNDVYTINDQLNSFSSWRGDRDDEYGVWHLLSKCTSPGVSTIGIAWTGALCTTGSASAGSGGTSSGTAVSTPGGGDVSDTVAHELGHNFGAGHDCTSNSCSNSSSCCACSPNCDCGANFLMTPVAGANSGEFSDCTIDTICGALIGRDCLREPGSLTAINSQCGNGLLDVDEECDCGGSESCADPASCCYENCTLKAGNTCNDWNGNNSLYDAAEACCENCQIRTETNFTCREAVNAECDVLETCNGTSRSCPTDSFVADGTECASVADGYCASGECTTRDYQCEVISANNNVPQFSQSCPQFQGACLISCSSFLEGCRFFDGYYFRDGTLCNVNGTCTNGECSDPDTIGSVIEWIEDNFILFIVLVSVGGLLVLAFLWWGCRRAGRKDVQFGREVSRQVRRVGNTIRRRPASQQNRADLSDPSADLQSAPPSRSRPPIDAAMGGPPPRRSVEMSRPSKDRPASALQVRCPICGGFEASEAALSRHLDSAH